MENTPNKKIMIIDDNPDFVNMITEYLQDYEFTFYKVVDFEDEEDIIKKVEEVFPHLILLDINLGKASGFKIIEVLKKSSLANKIPIIVITATDYTNTINKMLENEKNVFVFYSKLELDVIKDKINKILKE